MLIVFFSLLVFLGVALRGLRIVPQQQVWVVQRLGKFTRQLEPGLNWILPFADEIANRVSLKEEAIEVPEQTAITQDNVSVSLDGIVYIKIFDPSCSFLWGKKSCTCPDTAGADDDAL